MVARARNSVFSQDDGTKIPFYILLYCMLGTWGGLLVFTFCLTADNITYIQSCSKTMRGVYTGWHMMDHRVKLSLLQGVGTPRASLGYNYNDDGSSCIYTSYGLWTILYICGIVGCQTKCKQLNFTSLTYRPTNNYGSFLLAIQIKPFWAKSPRSFSSYY